MNGIPVPFLDLTRQHRALKRELVAATERVLDGSQFILGTEVAALERELAARCGAADGIGVASGTDALRLAFAALGLGPGDEVLTPALSFIASSSMIVMAGAAQPLFAGTPDEWPEAVRAAREVLSLPCYAEMTDEEVEAVVVAARNACAGL